MPNLQGKIHSTKTCQFCNQNFNVYEEDLEIYKKLSPIIKGKAYNIPTPTLCRTCRDQRRSAWRNERNLHKRTSSLSGTQMISFFAENSPFKVYTHEEWWSDKWNPMDYGLDFNFSQDFFNQFYKLQLTVPRPPLLNNKSENSDYCNFSDWNKDSYLITSANRNEACFYGWIMADDKDVVDSLGIFNCELIYECIDCTKSYNLRFCQGCENCRDSSFLLDSSGLSNCLFCVNLRNKSYYIFNKQSSKEEYEQYLHYLKGSYKHYQEALQKFSKFKKDFPIRKSNHFVSCENVTGNNIFNSKNIHECFDTYTSQDCRYCHYGLNAKDCSDICYFDGAELCYESTSIMGFGNRFTVFCRKSVNLFYCDNCHACKDCFGCIGLRNKQFCIFNKQYTQDEYEKLVSLIIAQMIASKSWGEFFPIKYSIFPYNETIAQEFCPITKETAEKLGWKWSKEESTSIDNNQPIDTNTLPDNINEIDNTICQKILKCTVTSQPFKIIQPELNFYHKMQLPIPRKCPAQRLQERMNLRTPRILWNRNCTKCNKPIRTTFSPDRPEQIHCEECYLKEIY